MCTENWVKRIFQREERVVNKLSSYTYFQLDED